MLRSRPFFMSALFALLLVSQAGFAAAAEQSSGSAKRLIAGTDKKLIATYLRDHAGIGACPPALAKKHNGCLPTGLVKQYPDGQSVPEGIRLLPLPVDLQTKLHAPEGYYFAQMSRDVVLVDLKSRKIADSVTLLSAFK